MNCQWQTEPSLTKLHPKNFRVIFFMFLSITIYSNRFLKTESFKTYWKQLVEDHLQGDPFLKDAFYYSDLTNRPHLAMKTEQKNSFPMLMFTKWFRFGRAIGEQKRNRVFFYYRISSRFSCRVTSHTWSLWGFQFYHS